MNWIDIVGLVLIVGATAWGIKSGLIAAAVNIAGVLIGWMVAGRLADDIGALFENSSATDTTVTVIAYILILLAGLMVTRMASKLIRPGMFIVDLASLGLNRMGGAVLGLLIGLVLSAAFITFTARLAYNFDISESLTRVQNVPTAKLYAEVEETRLSLETALADSNLASLFLKVRNTLPGDTLGFIPSDFKTSLDILENSL